MARLESPFEFTGTLGQFTAYRLPGVEGIVVRRKGGVSGKRIRTSPAYENTRRINAEFAGRSKASSLIIRMMNPVNRLADHSISGPLNALLKPIQDLDMESTFGKRSVMLSKNRSLLEGFSLNKKHPFTTVVRNLPLCSISHEEQQAKVSISTLVRGINFFPSPSADHFSFIAALGVVPDLAFTPDGYRPLLHGYAQTRSVITTSQWYLCREGSPMLDLSINLPPVISFDNVSFMLTVGIQYGVVYGDGTIKPKPHFGCGRVMLVQ